MTVRGEPSLSERVEQQTPSLSVCIANPWFYPILVGPGERFRRYAPGLVERGVSLHAFTVQRPGLSEKETMNGITIERAPPPDSPSKRWERGTYVYRLWKRFRDETNRPDVFQVLSPSRWYVPFLYGMKFLSVPSLLVFTLLPRPHRSKTKAWLQRQYWRNILRPYDRIVTSSGVMTGALEELGVPSRKLATIPNGVDLKRFRPASGNDERVALRQRLGIPLDAPVAVFVGSILPRKGIDLLLRAWHRVARQFPDACLVLVGRRHLDESKHAPFHRQVAKLVDTAPVPSRIIFSGAVPNVEEYLRAADIFVFTSTREGMPNVVPEAMASSLPCVLTPFEGLPEEFGRPGREYLLALRDDEDLARHICQLLEAPEKGQEVGDLGRRWVEEQLDVEKSLDSYAALYRELSGRRTG